MKKDQYTADRRDPVVKRLEREGITALVATKRVVAGVLLAVWLQPLPVLAIKRESVYDGLRRWEHGAYCQGLFRQRHWYTDYVAYFSGC